MTPERWQQLKQIFQSALERNPAERSAFLSQACADDPALRSQVESLIASHDQAGDSIEAMAAEAATEMLDDDQAGSIVGKQIGHYQVASALAAAHQAGIIHRDIKPENTMVRTDGNVKVLDFGLAKLTDPKTIETAAPTLPQVETAPGVVMGTFSYMSPEQARGLAVDTRTDIWSLGVMIYEMAAGRQPFEGETASDVMSLILQKEPPPLAYSWPEVPGELERIVRKALRKDREERYQTIKDLLIDLRNLRKELELSAEMERSAPPISARAMSSGQSAAATAHSASSAEYIVTEIKQHKRAAALIVGIVIIASAAVLYLLSRRSPATKEASLRN